MVGLMQRQLEKKLASIELGLATGTTKAPQPEGDWLGAYSALGYVPQCRIYYYKFRMKNQG
jgi:hypothetical protein